MSLIVLDRDGVINEESDDYIRSLADWRPIPGLRDALLARVAAVRNPDMAQMKRLLGDKRADRFADAFLKVLSDA